MTQEEIRAEKKSVETEIGRLAELKSAEHAKLYNLRKICMHPSESRDQHTFTDYPFEECRDCGWTKKIPVKPLF